MMSATISLPVCEQDEAADNKPIRWTEFVANLTDEQREAFDRERIKQNEEAVGDEYRSQIELALQTIGWDFGRVEWSDDAGGPVADVGSCLDFRLDLRNDPIAALTKRLDDFAAKIGKVKQDLLQVPPIDRTLRVFWIEDIETGERTNADFRYWHTASFLDQEQPHKVLKSALITEWPEVAIWHCISLENVALCVALSRIGIRSDIDFATEAVAIHQSGERREFKTIKAAQIWTACHLPGEWRIEDHDGKTIEPVGPAGLPDYPFTAAILQAWEAFREPN